MKNLGVKILLVMMAMLPVIGVAHPGHGAVEVEGYSILHYLTEPTHLVVIGITVSLILVIRRYALRRKSAANKRT